MLAVFIECANDDKDKFLLAIWEADYNASPNVFIEEGVSVLEVQNVLTEKF